MTSNFQSAEESLASFVRVANEKKLLFTPGPASLTEQNLRGLGPVFGRGDDDYQRVEDRVLGALKLMTGHSNIVRLQGSASLALEIVALNFLYGRVLIVQTGYYSERLREILRRSSGEQGAVTKVSAIPWDQIGEFSGQFDWVWACPTETSEGLGLQIPELRNLANRCRARLALDATGSIGLEDNHDLAEVISYSSCKGLFGLAGACFVAFNDEPKNEVPSFSLAISSHRNKQMTGPYHAIQSLDFTLAAHEQLRESVVINKERFVSMMRPDLVWPLTNQPKLCTRVVRTIGSKSGLAVLYIPRSKSDGSVVCHLGEVHLGEDAKGDILNDLVVES